MMEAIRVNSLKAWILAARPKTLTGAAVPVMMGLSLAWVDTRLTGIDFNGIAAALCLLFAFIMQIDANFINDYFDYKKGTDDETRLGPRRACAQGWVTTAAMRRAIGMTTALACLTGLPLVAFGGLEMVVVGLLCVVFCFLYTTHLSYLGLGDLLVLVFFGLVPVCCTYFLQTHTVTKEVVESSLACGMVIDTLLIVNNYRDGHRCFITPSVPLSLPLETIKRLPGMRSARTFTGCVRLISSNLRMLLRSSRICCSVFSVTGRMRMIRPDVLTCQFCWRFSRRKT